MCHACEPYVISFRLTSESSLPNSLDQVLARHVAAGNKLDMLLELRVEVYSSGLFAMTLCSSSHSGANRLELRFCSTFDSSSVFWTGPFLRSEISDGCGGSGIDAKLGYVGIDCASIFHASRMLGSGCHDIQLSLLAASIGFHAVPGIWCRRAVL